MLMCPTRNAWPDLLHTVTCIPGRYTCRFAMVLGTHVHLKTSIAWKTRQAGRPRCVYICQQHNSAEDKAYSCSASHLTNSMHRIVSVTLFVTHCSPCHFAGVSSIITGMLVLQRRWQAIHARESLEQHHVAGIGLSGLFVEIPCL